MRLLGNILRAKSGLSPMERGVRAAMMVESGNNILISIFGPKIVNFASCVFFRGSTLGVSCISSVAAQEIKFREEIITKELNNKIGATAVKKIQYLSQKTDLDISR